MEEKILRAFFNDDVNFETEPFGSGLINTTWRVTIGNDSYILQKINQDVFKHPLNIAENVRQIANYLQQHHPSYLFVEPIRTKWNEDLAYTASEGYFRLTPFVPNSHSIDVVTESSQAFEAAQQFGRFTALLEGMDVSGLHITIPDFHNLNLRYEQFEEAVKNGLPERKQIARQSITYLQSKEHIVNEYRAIRQDPSFKKRVTHHDTKISNVLLSHQNKGLCVIDLDTVMPGYFISDVGDMLRTYLSPASEEETDLNKVAVRKDIFEAVVRGYLSEMKHILSLPEKQAFIYAGKFMIYMQAVRFLADYLQGDPYYGARYNGHNLNRANNQIKLLTELEKAEPELALILNRYTLNKQNDIQNQLT